jgi:hypothetical protein
LLRDLRDQRVWEKIPDAGTDWDSFCRIVLKVPPEFFPILLKMMGRDVPVAPQEELSGLAMLANRVESIETERNAASLLAQDLQRRFDAALEDLQHEITRRRGHAALVPKPTTFLAPIEVNGEAQAGQGLSNNDEEKTAPVTENLEGEAALIDENQNGVPIGEGTEETNEQQNGKADQAVPSPPRIVRLGSAQLNVISILTEGGLTSKQVLERLITKQKVTDVNHVNHILAGLLERGVAVKRKKPGDRCWEWCLDPRVVPLLPTLVISRTSDVS